MIPIKDENKAVSFPFATYSIILLNIFAWTIVQGFGIDPSIRDTFYNFGIIPRNIVESFSTNWITIFSSMFMHTDLMHLIMNMWFLSIFGDNIEDKIGPFFFILFYFISGISAEILHVSINAMREIPAVGASGAISGLMGGYIILYPKAPVDLLFPLGIHAIRIVIPAYLMIGYWFILQILNTMPIFKNEYNNIAFWAHIGGFVAGITIIKLFVFMNQLNRTNRLLPGDVTND